MFMLQCAISQKLHKTKLKTAFCCSQRRTMKLRKIPWVIKNNPFLSYSVIHVSKDLVFKVQDKRKGLGDDEDGEQ